MRIKSFDYFRAIAIIFIVAGHSVVDVMIGTTEALNNLFYYNFIVNLLAAGTALFVFISGFFFHHLFYINFNFKRFMYKKIQNVYMPFLMITTILFFIYLCFGQYLANEFVSTEILNTSSFFEKLQLYIKYIAIGTISVQFWYIPFIMLIFLLSPLFFQYIRLRTHFQYVILLLSLCLALFIQRPTDKFAIYQNVIYFTPYYLLGILFSINRMKLMPILKGKSVLLGVLVILLAGIQAQYSNVVGDYYKVDMFAYNGISITMLQKVCLIGFLLSLLQRIEHSEIKFLTLLAEASFAIYFIHMFVKLILEKMNILKLISLLPEVIGALLFSGLVVMTSLLVAMILKKLLKGNSRYFIGW
jgi:probable poly-beta-1,6-N-acetyl-D-glucosamine export protein